MKDLKVPVISEEEKQKIWDELKVGDALFEFRWNTEYTKYHIVRREIVERTQEGYVKLDGGELLKYFEGGYYVETNEFKEFYQKVKLEDELMSSLNYVFREQKKFKAELTYEDALKLKEILGKYN